MQIGDIISTALKVRDLVGEHVLAVHEPSGKEYWFHRSHVEVAGSQSEAPAPPAEPAKVVPIAEADPNVAAAVKLLVEKGGYSEATAKEIVEKNGTSIVFAHFGDQEPAGLGVEVAQEGVERTVKEFNDNLGRLTAEPTQEEKQPAQQASTAAATTPPTA